MLRENRLVDGEPPDERTAEQVVERVRRKALVGRGARDQVARPEDVPRLEQALRSEGYYASRVTARVEGDSPPATAVVEVVPGRPYSLAAYDVRYVGSTPPPTTRIADPAALGIERGKPARAPAIVAAEQRLIARLAEEGRPKARIAERRATVDHEAATMSVAGNCMSGRVVNVPGIAS